MTSLTLTLFFAVFQFKFQFGGPTAVRCLLMFVPFILTDAIGAQEKNEAGTKAKASSYPVVVLERAANFSIPNAAAQPATLQPPVPATPFLPKEKYQRTAQPILGATELIAEGFEFSVVKITLEGSEEQIGLGTVVSLSGHVLTKYSLIKKATRNQIRFHLNGKSWSGTLVGSDETDDLAVFELHAGETQPEKTLRPITFTTDGRIPDGKIVIGIGPESKSLAVGMTTVPPLAKAMQKDCETCIDMGLTLDKNLSLTRVYPRTVGERLGLLVGDRLISINNKRVTSPDNFSEMEKEIQAGDLVSLVYQRQDLTYQITDRVPQMTKITKRDRWGGGPFSKRRNGFSEVLVHDSVIEPTDCGGPLVNLQGQFCGINIARSMRVASLAIPAAPVKEFLLKHLSRSDLIIQ